MQKTVNVSPETATIIVNGMTWDERDGKIAGVIVQQLDRNDYVKVNKALEALGGKWNRKAKAHLFDEDPPYIPLYRAEDYYAGTNNVSGFTPRASQFLDLRTFELT